MQGKMKLINGEWYWCHPHIGCRIEYRNGRDLTAHIIDWWLNHSYGDVPQFFLGDLVNVMGSLWNEDLEKIVWKHLEVKNEKIYRLNKSKFWKMESGM